MEADYYNAIPEGVIDDRFGIAHADFTSPEYAEARRDQPEEMGRVPRPRTLFRLQPGRGRSRNHRPADLIALLVDIVSKNGNLLLDVGPEADGTIPPVQMERLKALGAWLKQNGEAIYDTTPWTHATGKSAEGDDLRFTRKGDDLYVTVLGKPKGQTITIDDLPVKPGVLITQLGDTNELSPKVQSGNTRIVLRAPLKGEYAYAFKLAGYAPICTEMLQKAHMPHPFACPRSPRTGLRPWGGGWRLGGTRRTESSCS